jgi:predicted AAA+ superfamily ATPase
MEILKTLTHQGHDPQIYFWRTAAGSEVDMVVEAGDRLVPIEVKLSATPRPAFAKAIKAFRKDLGRKVMPGYVIHPGEIRLPLGSDVTALPLREL